MDCYKTASKFHKRLLIRGVISSWITFFWINPNNTDNQERIILINKENIY